MRQEMDMCSIVYQPCDEQSFRIGPSSLSGSSGNLNGQFTTNTGSLPSVDNEQMQVLADDSGDTETSSLNMTATQVPTTVSTSFPTTTTPISSTFSTTLITTTTTVSSNTTVSPGSENLFLRFIAM